MPVDAAPISRIGPQACAAVTRNVLEIAIRIAAMSVTPPAGRHGALEVLWLQGNTSQAVDVFGDGEPFSLAVGPATAAVGDLVLGRRLNGRAGAVLIGVGQSPLAPMATVARPGLCGYRGADRIVTV
ncbi:hypothetical protein AB0A95_18215 [Micromonospora sp. NPDC049230]|uniref:hypothetical protein n=1 Tax=Micromonospora sp. NPDC049230 TaxID=3155502 RepID=UPI003405B593